MAAWSSGRRGAAWTRSVPSRDPFLYRAHRPCSRHDAARDACRHIHAVCILLSALQLPSYNLSHTLHSRGVNNTSPSPGMQSELRCICKPPLAGCLHGVSAIRNCRAEHLHNCSRVFCNCSRASCNCSRAFFNCSRSAAMQTFCYFRARGLAPFSQTYTPDDHFGRPRLRPCVSLSACRSVVQA